MLNGSKTFITNGQHANLIIVVAKTDPSAGAKGTSLMVVETDDAAGFRRGRKLDKLGMDWADTSELFFEDVKLPAEGLLGTEEGQGFVQLMNELPQERLIVCTAAIGMIERALRLTIDYVKERKAFGKAIIEFQNTQFELAECKSEATIGRVFHDHCVERHIRHELDTVRPRWPNTGSPTCRTRSSTAACNCSAAMAIWTNIRSRACTATRAFNASMPAPTRS